MFLWLWSCHWLGSYRGLGRLCWRVCHWLFPCFGCRPKAPYSLQFCCCSRLFFSLPRTLLLLEWPGNHIHRKDEYDYFSSDEKAVISTSHQLWEIWARENKRGNLAISLDLVHFGIPISTTKIKVGEGGGISGSQLPALPSTFLLYSLIFRQSWILNGLEWVSYSLFWKGCFWKTCLHHPKFPFFSFFFLPLLFFFFF